MMYRPPCIKLQISVKKCNTASCVLFTQFQFNLVFDQQKHLSKLKHCQIFGTMRHEIAFVGQLFKITHFQCTLETTHAIFSKQILSQILAIQLLII